MDAPVLSLRYIRKRMEGCFCALCGDWTDGLVRGYQVALDGSPAPVCEECVEYHAPELIAARGAANAMRHLLDHKRWQLEHERDPQPPPF
jgi:ribosome-binding protein aMBF1 (putative translation factor)